MALTLLGGVARGVALNVPSGDGVRPTSVMLRRKIFDAYQHLDANIFVDLCAGTGAVGLEAWSRAAAQVYLIEADQRTFRLLAGNVKKVTEKLSSDVEQRPIITHQAKVKAWLVSFQRQYQAWSEQQQLDTILFLDPPYEKKEIYQEVVTFDLRQWYRGRLWIESDRQKGLASDHWEVWGEQFVKTYFQGTSYIAVLDLRQSLS